MGVHSYHYVVVGVKLDYDAEKKRLSPEKFEELYFEDNPKRGFEVIMDGMGAEYIVVGKIIHVSNEYSEDNFKELKLKDLAKEKQKVKKAIENAGIGSYEPILATFTHWS